MRSEHQVVATRSPLRSRRGLCREWAGRIPFLQSVAYSAAIRMRGSLTLIAAAQLRNCVNAANMQWWEGELSR